MGGGSWTTEKFLSYSTSMHRAVSSDGRVDLDGLDASQVYKQECLASELNPLSVIRECCDSEEHPNTIPVILALDVTGSMGKAAVEVAAELNKIMTELYKSVKDVEFMIMGIGDFSYDGAPLQVSQFESDIRIAEQLDKLYFEFGGGCNDWESYTAAWIFGAKQCRLDCWNRGRKGIIITMGDELINPFISYHEYEKITGQSTDGISTNTRNIYNMVKDKYELYHIHVAHNDYRRRIAENCKKSFAEWIGEDHVIICDVPAIAQNITEIIKSNAATNNSDNEPISW